MEYMKKADVVEQTSSHDVEQTVKSIIENVKAGGDDAVREYEKNSVIPIVRSGLVKRRSSIVSGLFQKR
ncbi:histidinol dehydrogenase [Peribacillus frigoritolerans]|nr:histidinol dehydrogenase [Peribacillus frigoritolerans]